MHQAKSVEEYVQKCGPWEDAIILLREIVRDSALEETIKWGAPAYTYQGKNIIGIAAFKAYVGIWFHQGVFLKDVKQKLYNAQEGKTKALRQWRFKSIEEIEASASLIRAYVEEAIQNQKDGKTIKATRKKTLVLPPELKAALAADDQLKKKFQRFTPGKRREFAEFISSAKRETTKLQRLEKIKPMISNGVGLMDRYRKG